MRTRIIITAVIGVALAVALTACGSSSSSSSSSGAAGGADGAKIAFLVPEDVGSWPQAKAGFETALKEQCPSCEMLYFAAGNDATKQQTQAQTAITQGAKVLVISAVDGKASATIATQAKAKNIPVVGFGRTPGGPITVTSAWSDEQLGEVIAQGVVDALKASGDTSGQIVMLNGDATTPNTTGMTSGAESVLTGYTIGRSENVKDWSAANAQNAMDQAITALGKDNIAGVVAADDNIAAGAIASLQRAGVTPLPAVGGMNASPAALQRILAGQQVSSSYLPYGDLGKIVAGVAVDLANGKTPTTKGTVTNATGDSIPVVAPPAPVLITKDNIKSALIDTGVVAVADICTPEYADACKAAGLA